MHPRHGRLSHIRTIATTAARVTRAAPQLGKPPVPAAGVLGVAVGVAVPEDDGVAPTDGDGVEVALRADVEGVGLAVGDRLALGVTLRVGDVDRDGCDEPVGVAPVDDCVPPWAGGW